MWIILFVILIFSTLAGLAYLTSRTAKFAFMLKLAGGNAKLLYLYSLVAVLAVFGILCYSFNLMNAVIVLLHLMIFWLVSDLVFGIAEHYLPQLLQHYYAGAAALVLTLITLGAGWFADHHVWTTYYNLETALLMMTPCWRICKKPAPL